MLEITFQVFLYIGLIIPSGDVDGREIYDLYTRDCEFVADYAYKGEVLEYLETGTFEYNEDLSDKTGEL